MNPTCIKQINDGKNNGFQSETLTFTEHKPDELYFTHSPPIHTVCTHRGGPTPHWTSQVHRK